MRRQRTVYGVLGGVGDLANDALVWLVDVGSRHVDCWMYFGTRGKVLLLDWGGNTRDCLWCVLCVSERGMTWRENGRICTFLLTIGYVTVFVR